MKHCIYCQYMYIIFTVSIIILMVQQLGHITLLFLLKELKLSKINYIELYPLEKNYLSHLLIIIRDIFLQQSKFIHQNVNINQKFIFTRLSSVAWVFLFLINLILDQKRNKFNTSLIPSCTTTTGAEHLISIWIMTIHVNITKNNGLDANMLNFCTIIPLPHNTNED